MCLGVRDLQINERIGFEQQDHFGNFEKTETHAKKFCHAMPEARSTSVRRARGKNKRASEIRISRLSAGEHVMRTRMRTSRASRQQ
jgi:hypothetical protein